MIDGWLGNRQLLVITYTGTDLQPYGLNYISSLKFAVMSAIGQKSKTRAGQRKISRGASFKFVKS